MVDRYPHSAEITFEETGTYDENTGKYSEGTSTTISLPECGFEYKGKNYQPNESGDIRGYDYIVWAPLFNTNIPDNCSILWNEENRSLTVKHVEKYNRHAKFWVHS